MKAYSYTLIAAAIFCQYACEDKSVIEFELAKEQLALRIEQYEQKKVEECHRKAFDEAELYVDSFLLQADLNPIREVPYNPAKQKKPNFIPVDSSVFNSESYVKPIKESD
jgi:hypothetical protein